MTTTKVLRDLDDGLILRRATVADMDELAVFNARIHSDEGPDKPDEGIEIWVRDLMSKPHPTFDLADFTIVEDTNSGAIVSSMNLIPQVWSYGGVEFGVGRPELVGTEPDYRRRGLVRAQFDVIHQWSADRGHKLQVITGIPYYYRQFEYEMGLSLGGGRVGYIAHIPKLKDDEEEAYNIRPATEEDIPFLSQIYEGIQEREALTCVWDEALWRYELSGKDKKSMNRLDIQVIESIDGTSVGFLAHSTMLWGPTIVAQQYELIPGISWLAVTPSVLRYMKAKGEEFAAKDEKKEFQAFAFWMGVEHPVYEVISDRLPRKRDPYAWYIRVPDIPDFLQHISPVLEQRVAHSNLVGHTGVLKLSFFKTGVKLDWDKGKLKSVEAYVPEHSHDGDILFPDLTFLQLLFGHHSMAELELSLADCYPRNDQARALVPILFPKQTSNIWPVS